jgi:hypothetical protein
MAMRLADENYNAKGLLTALWRARGDDLQARQKAYCLYLSATEDALVLRGGGDDSRCHMPLFSGAGCKTRLSCTEHATLVAPG